MKPALKSLGHPFQSLYFRKLQRQKFWKVESDFKGKPMNQTWENSKKTNFGSNFGMFGPNVSPQNFLVGFTSSGS